MAPTLPTEQEIKDSFSIDRLDPSNEEAVCRLFYHRIIYVSAGSGALFIDRQRFPLSGGEVFLAARGQAFSLRPSGPLEGYTLSFGDCFWERTPASANNCKAVLFNHVEANQHLPLDEDTDLEPLWEALLTEYNAPEYANKLDALAAYLKILMIKIANVNTALVRAYDNADRRLYREFLDLVSTRYQTMRDVADYAGLLHIPARKLSALCKACGGRGAKELINDHVISEAKRALQFSAKPVKEIAFELNFHTPEQFSHFFKTYVHVSPASYRSTFVNIGM